MHPTVYSKTPLSRLEAGFSFGFLLLTFDFGLLTLVKIPTLISSLLGMFLLPPLF